MYRDTQRDRNEKRLVQNAKVDRKVALLMLPNANTETSAGPANNNTPFITMLNLLIRIMSVSVCRRKL